MRGKNNLSDRAMLLTSFSIILDQIPENGHCSKQMRNSRISILIFSNGKMDFIMSQTDPCGMILFKTIV